MTDVIVDLEKELLEIKKINGKKVLSCKDAQSIAIKHGVQNNQVGTLCNKLKIKIVKCQLGCFK